MTAVCFLLAWVLLLLLVFDRYGRRQIEMIPIAANDDEPRRGHERA